MPKSSLSDEELEQFVNGIVTEGGWSKVVELLEDCHERKVSVAPGPDQKYFHKIIAYRDFDVLFQRFRCDGDTVLAADIQFKRPSRFPAPLLNRNSSLVNKLVRLLRPRYGSLKVEVKDDSNEEGVSGRQIHFDASSNSALWHASTSFEEWESECAIYDEPYSSGQTDPNETNTRNDFVIFRFRRKPA
jgi:hypothetical protein